MDTLFADVRYALRLLRKSPGFTAVAIATLALGIGANTAIFSTVDAVLIRALPYSDPDRIVMIWEDASAIGFPKNTPAPGNYTDWARLNQSFTGVAAIRGSSMSLTGDGVPEQLLGRAITPNFFDVLGVRPIVGRVFTTDEDRAGAKVAVISYGLWQRRYGGGRHVVGRRLRLNDTSYDIVGILPRDFVFRNRDFDYWIPTSFSPQTAALRDSHYLNVVARLAPGVTIDAARDDVARITEAIRRQFPDSSRSLRSAIVPIKDELLGNTRVELLVLMAAAAAVLLIACANLASLMLSRAVGRRGELAVRAALGATRGRLVRQMLVEATMFSLAGGGLGLVLAPAGVRVMAQLTPIGFAAQPSSIIDVRLLVFALGLSVATGVAFSLLPAIQAAHASLRDAVQQGARSTVGGRGRVMRDALVVLQVAAALVLLVGAGLMLRTLANLRAIDLGFRSDHLLTLTTVLPQARYADGAQREAFFERVVAEVRALPGVQSAAYAATLPFASTGMTTWFGIEGRPQKQDESRDALLRAGTSDYLRTIGARPVEGRIFDERDGTGSPRSIVVNETLARMYWPGSSPLGARIQMSNSNAPFYTVVGVVKDVRERGYQPGMKPALYLSYAQAPESWATPETLVVRVSRRPEDLTEPVRRIITRVDPDQPVSAVRTMEDVVDLDVADRQQQMVLLGAFAGLALLLASIGLYGVLSFAVTQRSRELGLRIALGATAGSVMRMVVARGLSLMAAGLGIGLALAWAATRAMQNILYGVAATDARTFGAVVALLATIALGACYFPARRASRTDPIAVLREE